MMTNRPCKRARSDNVSNDYRHSVESATTAFTWNQFDAAVLRTVMWPMMTNADVLNMLQCSRRYYQMISQYRTTNDMTIENLLLYRSHHPLITSVTLTAWKWLGHERLISCKPLRIRIQHPQDAGFSADDAAVIATSLQYLRSLQQLHLDECSSRSCVKALAAALEHNTSIKRFALDVADICDDGVDALAVTLRHNTTLEELIIRHYNKSTYEKQRYKSMAPRKSRRRSRII